VPKRAFFAAVLIAFVFVTAAWLWLQRAPLAKFERGGKGPPTVVLLHGYGSRAEDWFQFDGKWQFPDQTRVILLQAPLRHPISGRRGWWWLHLEGYIPNGERAPDLSQASPGGIKVASRLVRDAIRDESQPLILGGFSQGAMTSAEIAFQTDQEIAGLILLSGTTVNEDAWAEHFAGRRHLPIFIAHGTRDSVLPFAIMDRFQQRLKTFGLDVTWMPFEGDHEIPDAVVRAASAFVRRVVGLQSSSENP
jgi:phospholipase/carboxylesterase